MRSCSQRGNHLEDGSTVGTNQRRAITMTPDEVAAFLAEPQTMSIATMNHDATIHLVAMWYGLVDGVVHFETKSKSQKAQNLRRDPRISALVEAGDEYSALRGVELVGRARFVEDPDAIRTAAISTFERYHGPIAPGTDVDALVAGLTHKRDIIAIDVDRVVSWDHRKLA